MYLRFFHGLYKTFYQVRGFLSFIFEDRLPISDRIYRRTSSRNAVVHGIASSKIYPVTPSIPQGSVLSPSLFLLNINDIMLFQAVGRFCAPLLLFELPVFYVLCLRINLKWGWFNHLIHKLVIDTVCIFLFFLVRIESFIVITKHRSNSGVKAFPVFLLGSSDVSKRRNPSWSNLEIWINICQR